MTCRIPIPIDTAIFPAVERTELRELVRGNEQGLLAWLSPLTRRQSVTLDMSSVERIDAAGIAALLSLHASARETGHSFTVANLSPRVAEILSLVGLERTLFSHNMVEILHSGSRLESSAA